MYCMFVVRNHVQLKFGGFVANAENLSLNNHGKKKRTPYKYKFLFEPMHNLLIRAKILIIMIELIIDNENVPAK